MHSFTSKQQSFEISYKQIKQFKGNTKQDKETCNKKCFFLAMSGIFDFSHDFCGH